jgi:hypothetical protein
MSSGRGSAGSGSANPFAASGTATDGPPPRGPSCGTESAAGTETRPGRGAAGFPVQGRGRYRGSPGTFEKCDTPRSSTK